MNLLTISDGMGDSFAVPRWYQYYLKWPDVIRLLTKGCCVTNLSKFGAGNEIITELFRSNAKSADSIIIQWTHPKRLDAIVNNQTWTKQIAHDLVYHSNFVNINNQKFWLSSASPIVTEHLNFLSDQQYQNRLQLYIDYAKLYCDHNSKPFKFMLSYDSRTTINCHLNDWCWHKEYSGYDSFRHVSKFADLDFGYVQPVPLIAYDFVINYISGVVDLPWRSRNEIVAVENMLLRKHKEAMENKPSDTD